MANIDEILTATNYQDYLYELPTTSNVITDLFPEVKTDAFSLEYVVGANEIPIAASVHSTDSETEIGEREGLQIMEHDFASVRRKIKLDAKDAQVLMTPRTDRELQRKIQDLFEDAARLVTSVRTRYHAMAMEVFTTGKVTFDENGYKGTLDYKLPTDHFATPSTKWGSASAKPLEDLQTWANKIQTDTGVRPNRALTSQRVINTLLQHGSIRTAIYGAQAERVVTQVDLNNLLSAMGLPTFVAFDLTYRKQKTNGKGYDTVRYTSEDTVVLYVEGSQGSLTYAPTDEELVFAETGSPVLDKVGNIVLDVYFDNDPPARWTKASGKGLPSFPRANEVFIGQKVITL